MFDPVDNQVNSCFKKTQLLDLAWICMILQENPIVFYNGDQKFLFDEIFAVLV